MVSKIKSKQNTQQIEKPFVVICPDENCSLNEVVKAADILGLELHIILSKKQIKKTVNKSKK